MVPATEKLDGEAGAGPGHLFPPRKPAPLSPGWSGINRETGPGPAEDAMVTTHLQTTRNAGAQT